jgi:hypothetical protein
MMAVNKFAPEMHSIGGKARALALSPERRKEIATAAANARWKNNACAEKKSGA